MFRKSPLSRFALVALSLGAASAPGFAQESPSAWPSKPVSMVHTNAPGGGAETEARLYMEKLAVIFGKPFIIAQRPGAAGTIGAAYVAKAPADGYTYLIATTSFSVTPAFTPNLPYDVARDFRGVSLMSSAPIVLLASTSFAPNNLVEYIAYAKANPDKILWATSGSGAMNHLSGVLLHSELKTSATYVHYKGGLTAIFPDLLSGRVYAHPTSLQNALPHLRSGKLKPLAMFNRNRMPQLPDVRTAHEQGVADFEQPNYFGFVAAGGTSPAILDKLSTELAKVAKMPDIVKKMDDDGAIMVASTPAEFTQYLAKQVARWTALVKEKGIKQE